MLFVCSVKVRLSKIFACVFACTDRMLFMCSVKVRLNKIFACVFACAWRTDERNTRDFRSRSRTRTHVHTMRILEHNNMMRFGASAATILLLLWRQSNETTIYSRRGSILTTSRVGGAPASRIPCDLPNRRTMHLRICAALR